jgi:uncharacterized lipoprotein YmbA
MKRQKNAIVTRWLRTPIILICLLIASCATSPKANFYTLSAEQAAEELCSTNDQGLLITIELLHFPDLLAQPQIATRPQPNRIEYAEFHRWAGSLESDFQQSLGENLQQYCRSAQVIPDFWPGVSAPDYLLYLDVVRFDGNLGDSVNLSVNWVLKNKQQDDVLAERHNEIIEPVSDNSYSGLVDAQRRAVASLAREIIQTLR